MIIDKLLEKNLIPDALIRFEIRRLLKKRLKELKHSDQSAFVRGLKNSPIALSVDAANQQHYEVPAAFFEKALGARMKYSCAFYEAPADTLNQAEERMLALTCERAELQDGQEILELGCGWGSLTLWMAEKFPNSKILGVSNSASQRELILKQAKARGLANIEIMTQDMNYFSPVRTFDRVVSIEMFEHMRNVPRLFEKISKWLKDEGKLFVHIFSHREFSYLFEDRDQSDWMARFFFTGGMMPSHHLYAQFKQNLKIEKEWMVPGFHYSKTSEHWLENMDRNESFIREVFKTTYGTQSADLWWARWRIFFMACAELWGWKESPEWQVSHYLFVKAGKAL